ncbi:hypothetical protein SAMN05444166_7845 [Singulisphaera sp. GP187]|uniref:DUF58 domain-containing protein n=1 Tax=Singulisphaera sp. GP187 TaxID=1882752 RepID=UPI000927D3FA|nr:DUF58 domain-containing protein [Singulisphaera sp. GP187]SIO65812.1 hypothetical protein SAMN05444166_7845 [Singulisphaera sp. GP187]
MAPSDPPLDLTALDRAVAEAWPRAQARWSQFVLLAPPAIGCAPESVARIHLGTRQIELNAQQILGRGLIGSVEAILAHEVGHHVRYPGSLAVDARLRLLERSLIPIEGYSLLNLFTDLLINEYLGPDLHEPLAAVYRAFIGTSPWNRDPAFTFYLAVYEELWGLPPGDLIGPAHSAFARAYPGARADAQVLSQDLFPLGPNLYTQYLYFASVVSRYLLPPEEQKAERGDPYECGCGEPTADDWADALTPSAREREAVERAIAEGWITPKQGDQLIGPDALPTRILGLPGQGGEDAEQVPEVMAAYYRQQAEKYLFTPPAQRTLGEALVPTTLEDWEPGDPLRDIDWLATLVERGHVLGPAMPVKRSRVAEYEGPDVPLWQPRIEIYLDVSGSMPDPRTRRNAMTLGAQILIVAAIRAGGWARATLYSNAHVDYWRWGRSEAELSRFLMHYIGGGTEFPFDVLAASLEECRTNQPIRVIVTDPDFDANYAAAPEHGLIFAEAVRTSAQVVLLLHRPHPRAVAAYRSAGATVVEVPEMDDFPRMAADLARALFPEARYAMA